MPLHGVKHAVRAAVQSGKAMTTHVTASIMVGSAISHADTRGAKVTNAAGHVAHAYMKNKNMIP